MQSSERRWSTADAHASHGRALFPTDGRLWFYSGVVREVMASPTIQAAVDGSAQFGVQLAIRGAGKELEQATAWLEQSTTLEPDYAPGHLHLGRVLGEMGRHDQAAKELTRASMELRDEEQQYYARLFLGYERGELGDRDKARDDFESAAAISPHAQSPLLGLSQLARRFDDQDSARAALERLLALPVDAQFGDDPWWDYAGSHVRDAGALMDSVRRELALRVAK